MGRLNNTDWQDLSVAVGNISAGVSDCAGTGAYDDWSNPNNALDSDADRADVLIGTFEKVNSRYLRLTNLGSIIPQPYDKIVGIESRFFKDGSTTSGSTVNDCKVHLVKGGALSGDDKSTLTNWAALNNYETHGSSSDLWGSSVTGFDVNSSDFGVQIEAYNAGVHQIGTTAYIQHCQMKIYAEDNRMFCAM